MLHWSEREGQSDVSTASGAPGEACPAQQLWGETWSKQPSKHGSFGGKSTAANEQQVQAPGSRKGSERTRPRGELTTWGRCCEAFRFHNVKAEPRGASRLDVRWEDGSGSEQRWPVGQREAGAGAERKLAGVRGQRGGRWVLWSSLKVRPRRGDR